MSGSSSLAIAFLKRLIKNFLPRLKLFKLKTVFPFEAIFSAEQKSTPYGEDCGYGSPTLRGANRKYERNIGAPTIKGSGGPDCGVGVPTIRGGLSSGLNPPGPLGRRRKGRDPPAPKNEGGTVQIIPTAVRNETFEPGHHRMMELNSIQDDLGKENNFNTAYANVWPRISGGENLLVDRKNEPMELSSVKKVLTNVEGDKNDKHEITVNVQIEIMNKDNNK